VTMPSRRLPLAQRRDEQAPAERAPRGAPRGYRAAEQADELATPHEAHPNAGEITG